MFEYEIVQGVVETLQNEIFFWAARMLPYLACILSELHATEDAKPDLVENKISYGKNDSHRRRHLPGWTTNRDSYPEEILASDIL